MAGLGGGNALGGALGVGATSTRGKVLNDLSNQTITVTSICRPENEFSSRCSELGK
jgi:hypothetical protein